MCWQLAALMVALNEPSYSTHLIKATYLVTIFEWRIEVENMSSVVIVPSRRSQRRNAKVLFISYLIIK